MRSLALFRPTFQKIQAVISEVQIIKQTTFQTARKGKEWEKIFRTFQLVNSLQHCATDLQSLSVQQQLQKVYHFLRAKNLKISYDYQGKNFAIAHEGALNEKIQRFNLYVRSCAVEKIDHPALRQSLYFHELKDMQKIYKIDYPKNAPRYIRDMYKKNIQNQLLDSQNPLGLPIHAPPLQLIIEINGLFDVQLYCRYGNINIKTVRLIKEVIRQEGKQEKKYKQILNGMNIPREVQKVVYGICENILNLDQPCIYQLHRLAYIGGRVEQIQFLADLYSYFSSGLVKMDAIQ